MSHNRIAFDCAQLSMNTCMSCMYNVCVHTALNKAGRQAEALHLLEQLAENAVTETRSLNNIYLPTVCTSYMYM